MQLSTSTAAISCPYCGEGFEIVVDPSVAEQAYVEDCYVCCRPIHLQVLIGEEWAQPGGPAECVTVVARSENEC